MSSWIAGRQEGGITSIPIEHYRLFVSYRPFIRRGGDYLLLQRCIDLGVKLNSQIDFDVEAAVVGEKEMDDFHRKFYIARQDLLRTDRSYWLGLNTIYPGLKDSLKSAAAKAWILTTKEADFAYEIATAHGLEWDRKKIICSGKERKLDIISRVLGEGSARAVFIDDQIDHFSDAVDPRISCFLASWGYVVPEWLERDVEVIDEDAFKRLLAAWL